MTILKDSNSGKILRSASGEILTQSDALIDLRSTYGVTKNVSNEVSKVQIYNNPTQVLRTPVGKEPIENGEGFEFTGQKYIESNNNYTNKLSSNDFIIQFWIYPIQYDSYSWIVGDYINTVGSTMVVYFTSDTGDLRFIAYNDANSGIQFNFNGLILNEWNHVLITRGLGTFKGFIGGFYKGVSSGWTQVIRTNGSNPFFVGNANASNINNNYKLNSVKLNIGKTIDPTGYTIGEQVFTPPTYPNTLL